VLTRLLGTQTRLGQRSAPYADEVVRADDRDPDRLNFVCGSASEARTIFDQGISSACPEPHIPAFVETGALAAMTFSIERRIEFRDTDAAGIVHFSAFFPMMEAAEHSMLRSLGISVLPDTETFLADGTELPPVTWPRIAANCRYCAAARFEDLLRIEVQVTRIGNTSVEYQCRFFREDELIAEGTLAAVCCYLNHTSQHGTAGHLTKTPIPESIRKLLTRHQ
jgi:acyl-CoA thioester hydrolase